MARVAVAWPWMRESTIDVSLSSRLRSVEDDLPAWASHRTRWKELATMNLNEFTIELIEGSSDSVGKLTV
jgi:hypothetical protein